MVIPWEGFAALFAGAGVAVAWFQLNGIKKSLKTSSLMAVLEIEAQVNERKVFLDKCASDIRHLENKDPKDLEELKIGADLFECAKENYFNAMDRLCFCILRGYLKDKDWRAEYRNAVKNLIDKNPQAFDEASGFRNIKELNKKWQSE